MKMENVVVKIILTSELGIIIIIIIFAFLYFIIQCYLAWETSLFILYQADFGTFWLVWSMWALGVWGNKRSEFGY